MGLLDRFTNLDETQTQGLLAAASQMLQQSGPSRTPQGFGQIAGNAADAFTGSVNASKRRQQEEQQARQMAEMRALQIAEAQGTLQQHEASRRTGQRVEQFYENRRQRQGGQASNPGMGEQPQPQSMASAFPGAAGSPKTGGPDWLQAYQANLPPEQQTAVGRVSQLPQKRDTQQNVFEERLKLAQEMRAEGLEAQADQIEEAAYKNFRPKFSTTPQPMLGPDGELRNYQVSEDGSPPRDMGLGVKPDMVELNLGDRKEYADKNKIRPGQSYRMSMTPDQAADNANASANRAQTERHFTIRENRELSAPRGQIIQTDQGPMLADPRTGQARPMTGADGNPLGPKARPIPTQIQKAYVENASSLRKVDAALAAVTSYPAGLGVSNYLGDAIRQRSDPKGVNVRALVADIGSQKIHDRSGAAVTAAETPRLKPFIPASTDDPATVAKKLTMFKAEYQAMQTEMEELYSADMGYRPLGKPENGGGQNNPTATQGPKRKAALKGQVMNGYRFKGGDPSKQENWEQI